MVVDDDRDARELLTATLGYYGADVDRRGIGSGGPRCCCRRCAPTCS